MQELKEFCEKLGSKEPTPGGGAAAGITLSLGAACAEKAVRFSEGDYPPDLIDRLVEIRDSGFILTEKDQVSFRAWMDARKLPKSTDEEKRLRDEQIKTHVTQAILVPYKICKKGILLLELLNDFLPCCNKWLVSDAAIGVSFAKAAFDAGLFNIKINLSYLKDEKLKKEITDFQNEKPEIFNGMYERLIDACHNIVGK